MNKQLTFICVSCDFKGTEFLRALHDLGHKALLITSQKTENDPWPRDCIENIFFMPQNDGRSWDLNTLESGVAYLFREYKIDKIIALDDYDVKKAAWLREIFRSPGMGDTTARHFYDKLSMRMIAADHGIQQPAFTGLFHDEAIKTFMQSNPAPWLVKPRSDAGALGIRKLNNADEFWKWNEQNQEQRHRFLLETFKPGHIYHVDALFTDFQPLFTRASRYLQPPFEVAHGGGVFRSQTTPFGGEHEQRLTEFNAKLLRAFGLKFGASHSEFIYHEDSDEFYFLETSARVGGAHLADMVEAATGINLWYEWAQIEVAMLLQKSYSPPVIRQDNAGIVVTLSKFEKPDYSALQHPSLVWTLQKKYHVGLIFRNAEHETITHLLNQYTNRIFDEYHTTVPLKE